MIDETLINPYLYQDLRNTQSYRDFMKKMEPTDGDCYNIQYHHSILDSDNVSDSIKVKVLYNELMSLKAEFLAEKRTLMGEISYLNGKNKKLEDEITAIKQTLYFG